VEDESMLTSLCAGEFIDITTTDGYQIDILKQWWSLGFLEERFLNDTH
jgi:hypothetical protein